ncbi:GDP-L-fucose synthase family protein [Loktanella agnita]|uniref:GDP-L-fucose synthase family protein n=1 Tax=Loktanella agnita TaxID=287097 RepID=UPI003986CD00
MCIYVAGHTGMVGSAILRALKHAGTDDVITATRQELDLTDQPAVRAFLRRHRPDTVILAAARVGGIMANESFPASFIRDNLTITTNVIDAAHQAGVQHLLNLGSSCIYPRDASQPIMEEALLTGPLEPSNAPYAVAKIAGITLCESYNRQYGTDYRSLMPCNLYGPGDNFHPDNSHVLPGLIRRFHEAAQAGFDYVVIWGSGTPRREFLHVDDLAEAARFVLDFDKVSFTAQTPPMCSHINVGTGHDISIINLAHIIADIVGFRGRIVCDRTKPDGTDRKLLDSSRLTRLGWSPKIALRDGIVATYDWYRTEIENGATLRAS